MAWQPKGKCYAFYESSITVYAPEDSGVYGLFNFDYQLCIGESANVRAALLQHLKALDSHPARYQPAGFAFELCPPEQRGLKTEQLIAEHKPVRQGDWSCADARDADFEWQEENRPFVFDPPGAQPLDDMIQGVFTSDTPPVVRKRFQLTPGRLATLAVIVALGLSAFLFRGIFTGGDIQEMTDAGKKPILASVSRVPSSEPSVAVRSEVVEPKPPVDAAAPATSSVPAERDVNKQPMPSQMPVVRAAPQKIPAPVPIAAKVEDNQSDLASAVEQPAQSTAARSSERETAWAVQLAASREKTVTEMQVAKLKAKGYDSYTVEAERDGQTWYRVRVGRFPTRGEAEALREILVSREGYRNPFVTTD